ncbi:5-aminovalerate aminotransferase DavT [Anatilimnocola aggregata]|uniref:5-aminovalerate aminotransferase DavT n=1 Tax=Anatilimnocola aggregata TaxID=2528021 RepID=A0A517YKI3_9BACT|nr:acetyl ornithine aminotransferase family protein [Anatilimnocola aggregata]QDU30743.1 5-aminovalerate aminotransferase DavT [Anatilimnocola aggregata]
MNIPKSTLPTPWILTELPGPKGKQLIANDERYTSPSYTRAYPLAVERGEGSTIEDVDGNRFLDFTSGIAVCSTGHCHPRVVAAIETQTRKLIHMSGTDFYYAPQGNLAQKLAELAPGSGDKRVFFTNSGAESVEAAFKLARFHTGRQHMIAFFGAFHGRTMGALSLTGSKMIQRRGFAPLIPQVTHIDYANCYRCPQRGECHQKATSCCLNTLNQLEDLFRRTVPPTEVAGIIVEPIQGEGGYVVPPPEFHRELKALAEKHGILYIVDEVQSGMGRTGKMFAIEHWGVVPDIICLAKGIASGLPLGAIIARADLMDWGPGSHASTFGGNPISCVAALTTIELLEESLMVNATEVGNYLQQRLRELMSRHAIIGDVRGLGLMVGAELVKDRETKEPAASIRDAVVQACFHRGLLMLGCGTSTLRFCPPLVVTRDEVDTAVQIIDSVLSSPAELAAHTNSPSASRTW